jgi:hypothetical protein
MKFGKHPPQFDLLTSKRRFTMAQFLSDTAPAAPDSMDWFSRISDWGMMRNDKVGCCTYAGLGHMRQAQSAATGSVYTVSDDTVISGYSALTGYDPSQDRDDGDNPTDQGANELDVIKWVERNGFGGDTLVGHADVDISNRDHIKRAIYLFGGAYIGVALPLTAQKQQTWDVVLNSNENQPGSWGLHCMEVLGYDADLVWAVTWGGLQAMTWKFVHTYFDEIHALLTGTWDQWAGKDFNLGNFQQNLRAIAA